MGGSTLSPDYGPSASSIGFLYAVDLEGNWKWGNFYFDASAVSDITGCTLSTDKSQLVAFGLSLGKPVIMMVDKSDGKVTNLISGTA